MIVQTAPDSELSFGHLTFQEHLAGSYLADFMPPVDVLPFCRDPWWTEPVKFYASKKGDIAPLITAAVAQQQVRFMITVLAAALLEAPYTPKRAARIIHDATRLRPAPHADA